MLAWLACSAALDGAGSEGPVVDRIDATTWRFPSDAERARYDGARQALAAAFAGGDHTELARSGNFLRESWASGGDRASLAVLHAPARYPEVFGLVFDRTTREGELTVDLHWSRGGARITGDVVVLGLHTPTGALELSSEPTWVVGMNTVRLDPVPAPALVGDLVRSAGAFQARGAELVDGLAARVEAHLARGDAQRCEYGPPQSGGRPPECVPTPMSAAEVQAERDRIRAWSATAHGVLERHGAALWAQLAPRVPPALTD
ncbi:MAG: hypothetical protein ABMA64_22795 [Myxococcota bacterium]